MESRFAVGDGKIVLERVDSPEKYILGQSVLALPSMQEADYFPFKVVEIGYPVEFRSGNLFKRIPSVGQVVYVPQSMVSPFNLDGKAYFLADLIYVGVIVNESN